MTVRMISNVISNLTYLVSRRRVSWYWHARICPQRARRRCCSCQVQQGNCICHDRKGYNGKSTTLSKKTHFCQRSTILILKTPKSLQKLKSAKTYFSHKGTIFRPKCDTKCPCIGRISDNLLNGYCSIWRLEEPNLNGALLYWYTCDASSQGNISLVRGQVKFSMSLYHKKTHIWHIFCWIFL